MIEIKKVCGYTVKNQRPAYKSKQDKENAEQMLVKKVLKEYNRFESQKSGSIS